MSKTPSITMDESSLRDAPLSPDEAFVKDLADKLNHDQPTSNAEIVQLGRALRRIERSAALRKRTGLHFEPYIMIRCGLARRHCNLAKRFATSFSAELLKDSHHGWNCLEAIAAIPPYHHPLLLEVASEHPRCAPKIKQAWRLARNAPADQQAEILRCFLRNLPVPQPHLDPEDGDESDQDWDEPDPGRLDRLRAIKTDVLDLKKRLAQYCPDDEHWQQEQRRCMAEAERTLDDTIARLAQRGQG